MSRRAWAWGVPAAVLVLAALGSFYATSTPRYALYRLGVAKQRLRPQVVTRVRLEIRRSVERAGIQVTALVLPVGAVAVFRAFEVSSAGPDVWVTYRDPAQGPVRFRMSRQADRGWQISEFDPEWVRRRAQEEPPRIR